jgi:TolB-like protein/DNA-binding winged helix-turn-helix (wHTH) protein
MRGDTEHCIAWRTCSLISRLQLSGFRKGFPTDGHWYTWGREELSLEAGTPRVCFGLFEVDIASGTLRKEGVKIKLQEQPFQALVALLERPQEILTREELQKRLWPGGTFVDFDRGLNKAINRLRDALGDDAENPRFIQTLPQRGYRFLAPVENLPSSPALPPSRIPLVRQRIQRRGLLAVGGGLIAASVLGVIAYRTLKVFSRHIESIAVLPLENVSGDPAQEYFSDGMTDELIGEIARIRSLRVISRTSVMRYKGGARKSLPEIARELNVDVILEGTVALSGSKVRITTQLIRAQEERNLWSERYERDLADILALQSEVARSVAHEIQIQLTPQEQTRLARKRPVNPAGYEAFLKGNYFLHRGIPGMRKSIEFFTEAIRLDPAHAEAHAGLAHALCYAGIFGLQPSKEAFPAARAAALKALELDESNASAHNVLADVRKGYDWDFVGAITEYRRALQLNPSHLLARLWYAECLTRMERYNEALAESERALRLDPVSPQSLNVRAMLLFRARRYDDAIRVAHQALELDPAFVNALWWEGLSHAGKRDYSKSIARLTVAAKTNDSPIFRGALGHVYGLAGQKGKAIQMLEELTAMSKQRYVSPVDFAILYAGLGDVDATFRWLENAYQTRATRVHELKFMYFDNLRPDPRYADLARRVGLPI